MFQPNYTASGAGDKPGDDGAMKAALTQARKGRWVVPVPPGEKGPTIKGWQKLRLTEAELPMFFSHGDNIGLLTGLPPEYLVDIDLDSPEARALRPYFIPKTLLSGRRSSSDSHAWYRSGEPLQTHRFRDPTGKGDNDRDTLVEMRGDGAQTLIPPSLHPSGELYEWGSPDVEPTAFAAGDLRRQVGKLAAGALIARHWPARGSRNDAALALAGGLLRGGWPAGKVELMIDAIAKVAGDEQAADRVAAVFYTAEKLREGNAVTGWPRLAEIMGEKVVEKAREWLGVELERRAEHTTDLGNARRLVSLHGQDLHYCHPWDKWLAWDDARWCADETAEVYRRAKDAVREIYAEAVGMGESERKTISRWAISSETRGRIDAMIALARSEPGVPVLPDQLDADRWLLNVANGTVDLRTGVLREHRRGDFITKLAPVDFNPAAKCPLWTVFLRRIMAENEALIMFLQRAVGYSLTGDVSEQVLFLLYGTGANGKSTFIDVVLSVLGGYATMTAPGLLLSSRNDRHPTEVADLFGARFAASVEVGEGRRMAEERVKQLTGGDRVKARRMQEDFWEFAPTHKLWIAANHKPVIRGTDLAIWRRIRLVPFTVAIPKEEQDRGLPGKLKAEAAGILAWAVQGCLNWQREGLATPAAVDVATGDYREEMDILADFIAERCVEDEGAESTAGKLYDAYAVWAKLNGDKFPLSKRAFGLRLGERGFESVKQGKSRVRSWRGIRLSGSGDRDPHESDDLDPELGKEDELPEADLP
jgi:putative DNA primase/helicase